MKKANLIFTDGKGNKTGRIKTVELPEDVAQQNIKTTSMDWYEDEDEAMQEYESLCFMCVDLIEKNKFQKKGEDVWVEFFKLTPEDKANGIEMSIDVYDRNKDSLL
jgi:hypothetical protein